jgi:hypothetical protein
VKDLSTEQIQAAWDSASGLEWMGTTVRELPFGDPKRALVRDIVHKAVCPEPTSFKEYQQDYDDAFVKDKKFRVLAAFRDNSMEPVGGAAFCNVPEGEPEALYVEFFGVVPESHVGKSMIEQLQQYVKMSPQFRLIALNSLNPTHKKQRGDQAIRTASFWSLRGFTELTEMFLCRLTAALEPQRLAGNRGRPWSLNEFYKRFAVPQAEAGTIPMVWLPMV